VPRQLTIDARPGGDGTLFIALDGELDIATAHQLRQHLNLAAHEGHDLVCDLTGLTFIDATGVAVLVRMKQQLRHRFRVVEPKRAVQLTFDAAGLPRSYWE
jgi:anti-anti-sigma factor